MSNSIDSLLQKSCKVQLSVLRASYENIDASVTIFREIIKKGKKSIQSLIGEILSIITLQSERIPIYIDIIGKICSFIEQNSAQDNIQIPISDDSPKETDKIELQPEQEFKKQLFNMCFKTATSFRAKIPHFYFLRKLMKKGIFTIAEIGNKIAKFPVHQSNQLFSLFLVFAPELAKHRKTTYKNTLAKFAQFKALDPSLQTLSSAYADLSKDDFARLLHNIEYGSDINSVETALRTNNVEQLKLLSSKPEFNVQKQMGKIALEIHEVLQERLYYIEYAAFYGSIDCMDYLLSIGSENKQAASYAVAGGDVDCIKYCVNKAFPVNKMISSAIHSRRYELIDQLIKMIGEKSMQYLNQVYFICAKNNDVAGLHCCLSKGIDINSMDIAQCTAAVYAASNGSLKALKFLIQAGCNPSTIDITGWNALHFATKYGYLDIVKYLSSLKGFDINSKTGRGKTALHIACEGNNLDIITFLLSLEGIDTKCIDSNGQNAFSYISSADVKNAIEKSVSPQNEEKEQ